MKRFSGFLLLASSMWAQAPAPPAPAIRDAFVQLEDKSIVRSMKLNETLQVVVCKAEFDAWAKGTNPEVLLYLDGRLMKNIPGGSVREVTKDDPIAKDDGQGKSAAECAKVKDALVGAADADVKKASAAAADADAKAAAEADPAKKLAAQSEAKTVHAALDKATATRAEAAVSGDGRYILAYYLDARLVGKADEWLHLLEKPWEMRKIPVSLGLQAGPAWPRQGAVDVERIRTDRFVAWAAFFVAAVIVFIRYARNSDIIRDSGPALPVPTDPATGSPLEDDNGKPLKVMKTYSLAKTSMAMWTFIVAAALVFIFVVTANENSLSPGALMLIGISFGTTALAGPAGGQQDATETKGFLTDLLSEEHSVSFHRYQMVLFSIILAVIFIVKTATSLTMPDFDANLLSLMGISSGTYLGFKVQGK